MTAPIWLLIFALLSMGKARRVSEQSVGLYYASVRKITVDVSRVIGKLKNFQGTNNADTSLLPPGLDDIHDEASAIGDLWSEYGIRHVLVYDFPDVFMGFGKSGKSGDPSLNKNYNWTLADQTVQFVISHGATISINFKHTNGTDSTVSSPETLGEIGYMITDRYVNGAHQSGFKTPIELFDFYAESDLTNSPTILESYQTSFAYFSAFAKGVTRASKSSGVGAWGGNRILPPKNNYTVYDPYVSQFYKDCKDNNIPIKAATYHFTNTQFSLDPYDIKTITDDFREQILVPAGFPDLPVWVTEYEINPNGVLPKSAKALSSYNDPAFIASYTVGVTMYAQDTNIDQVMPWTGFGYGGYGALNAYFTPWFNQTSKGLIPLNVAAAWKLQAELVLQTPNRLYLDGSSPNGFAALAGSSSRSKQQIQILLNNYQPDYDIAREIAAQLVVYMNTSTTAYPLIQANGLFNGEQSCFADDNSVIPIPICQTYLQATVRDNESDAYRLVVDNLPWDQHATYDLTIQRVGGGSVHQIYAQKSATGNSIDLTVPFPANAQDLVTITLI